MHYADKTNTYTLSITCPARTGIIAAVTTLLAERDYDIKELEQFDDQDADEFFMRCVFTTPRVIPEFDHYFTANFSHIADRFSMKWRLRATNAPQRVLIMVSRPDHALRDLLYRREKGDIFMDLVGVASNHLDLAPIVERSGAPFFHLPVSKETRAEQEAKLLHLITDNRVDLVVLARYMQILSPELAAALSGRAINIHHSFLPSFKGAGPYRQAHERGVKLIGATAHYVTSDLDEGPIIEQDVRRVGHKFSARELEALGRDIESAVLARAVKIHLEDRVFIHGHKTIVLE